MVLDEATEIFELDHIPEVFVHDVKLVITASIAAALDARTLKRLLDLLHVNLHRLGM